MKKYIKMVLGLIIFLASFSALLFKPQMQAGYVLFATCQLGLFIGFQGFLSIRIDKIANDALASTAVVTGHVDKNVIKINRLANRKVIEEELVLSKPVRNVKSHYPIGSTIRVNVINGKAQSIA